LAGVRELRDDVWWSAQDTADYANGQLAEALRQLRAGEPADEYKPSAVLPAPIQPGQQMNPRRAPEISQHAAIFAHLGVQRATRHHARTPRLA
jgi:hypothetical protein